MQIKTNPSTLDTVKDNLIVSFVGKPYTEGTMEAIQDALEHALVTYTPEDIRQKRFLNRHLMEHTNPKRLQLFVTTDIFIDVTFRTDSASGFKKISKIEDIKVLDSGS